MREERHTVGVGLFGNGLIGFPYRLNT